MSIRAVGVALVVFAALGMLQGCGGADGSAVATTGPTGGSSGTTDTGGSGSTSQPQLPMPQTLVFADTGPVSKVFGDPDFADVAAGGAGNGTITYSSGNTAVAEVDA